MLFLVETDRFWIDKMILPSSTYQGLRRILLKCFLIPKLYCLRTGTHLIHSNYGLRGSDWYIEKMLFEGTLEISKKRKAGFIIYILLLSSQDALGYRKTKPGDRTRLVNKTRKDKVEKSSINVIHYSFKMLGIQWLSHRAVDFSFSFFSFLSFLFIFLLMDEHFG